MDQAQAQSHRLEAVETRPNPLCGAHTPGIGNELAAQTAGSPHGPWRISNSPRSPSHSQTPSSDRASLPSPPAAA